MERKALKEMYSLQQKFNNETNGIGWENGTAENGKEINWLRCIYMEGAELIDSTPWKHWKNVNASPDLENIKVELVDIWHFIMSQGLKDYSLQRCVELSYSYSSYFTYSDISIEELTDTIEDVINHCTSQRKTTFREFEFFEDLLSLFFLACEQASLSFDELYKMYIGKNCLNKFRQNNGYKDGTYIKVWNGKEDNVVMMEILNFLSEDEISFENLYSELEKLYSVL